MRIVPGILVAAALTLTAASVAGAQEPAAGAATAAPETTPPATAPETAPPATRSASGPQEELYLELNNLQPIPTGGCRLTVIARNGRAEPIERLGVEVVVFDAQRRVDQFLVLEFSRLMSGKTKAGQFDFATLPCDQISQVLVNDVLNCGDVAPGARTCTEMARLENLTDIDFQF